MLSYFGHKGAVDHPLDFFREEHYVICRGATDPRTVDRTFQIFNDFIVKSKDYYLRQSSQWERSVFTNAGGIANCLLQPHQFTNGRNGEFSDAILQLLSAPGIHRALEDMSGIKPYVLVQTMFFDHSVTGPHQDWIYLDSRPNGKMIAAWIALEDIPEDCIRFYVYPGTHTFTPKSTYRRNDSRWDLEEHHSEFINEIHRFLESGTHSMYAPPLKKGDIFFWSSRIIHGSTEGTNKLLRRRSIAAHFIPDGCAFGNLEVDFETDYGERYGLRYVISRMDEQFQQMNAVHASVQPSSGQLAEPDS